MFEQLCEILKNNTFDEDLVITPESRLDTDIGLSSYNIIELVCEVEHEFGVQIPSEELATFYTVDDICRSIRKLKGEAE